MRGGIPLLPRSAKKRSKKNSKLGLRTLQSGIAVSILLLYTSQQIGSTYGGFSDTAEETETLTFCSVFPSSVVRQLTEIKSHILKAVTLMNSLKGYSLAGSPADISGIEAMSLEELDAAEQALGSRLSALHSEVGAVTGQLNNNIQTWNELIRELNAVASALAVIGGYMLNLDSNCLEIKDDQILTDLQDSIAHSGVLSESLNASLNGIIRYLKSIRDNDLFFTQRQVTDAVYGQSGALGEEPQQSFPFLIAFQQDGQISNELTSVYEGFNNELNSALSSTSSEIARLEQQREIINQTRTRKLEEQEALKKAEEEKLVPKEEPKQEEAPAAADDHPAATNAPSESGAPDDIKSLQPVSTPEAAEPNTAPPASPVKSEPEALIPEAPPAEHPASADPAATEPPEVQNIKGGE